MQLSAVYNIDGEIIVASSVPYSAVADMEPGELKVVTVTPINDIGVSGDTETTYIYKDRAPIVSINANDVIDSTTPLTIYGTIRDLDIGINVSGFDINDSIAKLNLYTQSDVLISALPYSSFVTNESYSWSFTWTTPIPGTTKIYVLAEDSYGCSATATCVLDKIIGEKPTIVLNTPTTSSKSVGDVLSISATGSISTGSIKTIKYYINDVVVGSSLNSIEYRIDFPGIYEVKAKAISNYDVESDFSNVAIISVASAPAIKISSPTSPSYSMIGSTTIIDVNVFGDFDNVLIYDNGNYQATLDAPYYYNWVNDGTNQINIIYSSGTDVNGFSAVSNAISFYTTSAVKTSASSNKNILGIGETVSLQLSALTKNKDFSNSNALLTSADLWKNGTTIIKSFELTGTTYTSAFDVDAYLFGTDIQYVYFKVYDSTGSYGTTSAIPLSVSAANTVQSLYPPKISLISQSPEGRFFDYGDVIELKFKITNEVNTIIPDSIGFDINSPIYTSTLTENVYGKDYTYTVMISAGGDVGISAMNNVALTATLYEYGFLFGCIDQRKINLVDFIPTWLREYSDSSTKASSEPEMVQFVEFFENYLNTLYNSADDSCSLSILSKINSLTKLHDPDTIDMDYIQYFANLMGYNLSFSRDTINTTTESENDDELNRYIRFTVRNLPNWYRIKSTRNAVKVLLLSFGIVGDLIEYHTSDYEDEWIPNTLTDNKFLTSEISSRRDLYPTPHMAIGIDMVNSQKGWVKNITEIIDSLDAIRPVNVVFDNIVGYINSTAATVNVDMAAKVTYTINADYSENTTIAMSENKPYNFIYIDW